MKYVLIILAIVLVVIGVIVLCVRSGEGVSGESTIIGDSFVLAEFGYGPGGRLTYAVIRSFPKDSTDAQKRSDPRYRETSSGVLIRNEGGQMVPVGKDGIVYFFEGDRLRTMRVDALESDIGLGGDCRSLDDVWAKFQHFEIRTNK